MFGATYRDGWKVPVIPNTGFIWQPEVFGNEELFRLEAMIPKSRFEMFPGHIITLFATAEWRNTTYGLMDDEPGLPDKLSLDDILVTAGVSLSPFGYSIVGEVGTFLRREMSANVQENKSFDLSKETFFRITIGGKF